MLWKPYGKHKTDLDVKNTREIAVYKQPRTPVRRSRSF